VKLESTVEKFPGYVILPTYLNIYQVREFEDSLGDVNQEPLDEDRRVWISTFDEKRLPVVLSVVQEWHIEGVPEKPTLETFPMTPQVAAHELVTQLFNAVYRLWIGETVPNA